MIRFRFYYDPEKEEKFLNSMSAKGWAMKKFFLGFYTFERCSPGEYTYRIDLISGKKDEELIDYIELIRDSGAEYVQQWCGNWAYFRKKGDFELYTDTESLIAYYKRIRKFYLPFAIAEALIAFGELGGYLSSHYSAYLFAFGLLLLLSVVFFLQAGIATRRIRALENR